MRKIITVFFSFLSLLTVKPALAFCPVCTIAVGAGLGLSRWLKIDDTISGVWIGGLVVSLIGWTVSWLNSKKVKFFGRKAIVVLFYYFLIIAPLFWGGLIGHPFNRLWGMDKLLVGITFGSLFFFGGGWCHNLLKKENNGRVYFPLQKVILPVFLLVVLSIFFYLFT